MSINVHNPDKFTDRPSAVLFDFDNTLYLYQPAHEAGMAAVSDKATRSLGAGQAEFDEAFLKARDETKKQLGNAASSHSRLLYFQRTLEHLGLRSQALMSLEFEQAYWGSFLSAVELREGVLNFLDMLTRANIPKVIVTDLTTAIQLRKLVYLELDRHFEYVVTSEESGADKPDRAGFDLAMSKLSMTGGPDRLDEPEASENSEHSVWMIGDNMTSDIQGAKKAINATTLTLKSEIGNQGGHEALDMDFDTFNDLERFFVEAGWDTPVR